jgi:hypothetical protein
VRLVAPQQLIISRPDIWRALDTLGWVHRPNVNTTINTGERTVQVVTDTDGFRVGRTERAPGRKRILLLGDSFMEAFQVEYEQSVAGLLEARLPGAIGATVTVVNTGVGGWDPPQYFLQARATLARRRFDLVLVSLFVGNDVVLNRPARFSPRAPLEVHTLRFPKRVAVSEVIDALLYPLNDYFKVRSHLFAFLKARFGTTLTKLRLTATDFPAVLLRSEATSPRWEVTAEICRDIAALGARQGAPTLFFLVPTPYQVDRHAFEEFLREFDVDSTKLDLDQPNRLLFEVLERDSPRVLDALSAFRSAQRAGIRLYGSVDRHLSPGGHDVLERFIEPTIAALLTHRRQAPSSLRSRPRTGASHSIARFHTGRAPDGR